jgi:hypothetical protein
MYEEWFYMGRMLRAEGLRGLAGEGVGVQREECRLE